MEQEKVNLVLVSAFVAVEALHGYSAVLPSIFTIRHFGCEPGTEKAIRDGELVGTALSVGLGAVVSAMVKSSLPLFFSIGASAIMVSVYEYALRTRTCGSRDSHPVNLVEVNGVYVPVSQTARPVSAGHGVGFVGVRNA